MLQESSRCVTSFFLFSFGRFLTSAQDRMSEVCLQLGVGRLAEGLVVLVLLDGLVVLFELVEGLVRKGISSLPPPSCSTDLRAARAPAPAPKTHMLAPSTFLQPDHSANDTNINKKYKNSYKILYNIYLYI